MGDSTTGGGSSSTAPGGGEYDYLIKFLALGKKPIYILIKS